jgi:hypothetical protein
MHAIKKAARFIPGHALAFTGCMLVTLVALAAFTAGRESVLPAHLYRGDPPAAYVAHGAAQGRPGPHCRFAGTPRVLCVARAPRAACRAALGSPAPCWWYFGDRQSVIFNAAGKAATS